MFCRDGTGPIPADAASNALKRTVPQTRHRPRRHRLASRCHGAGCPRLDQRRGECAWPATIGRAGGPVGCRGRSTCRAARESRGPYPRRPRHRAAQPSPPRRRAESDLAGARPDRARPARLDAPARAGREGPAPGARRLRLFSTAAHLVTTGRRRCLRLAVHRPGTDVITGALDRLRAQPNPGWPAPARPRGQHQPTGAVGPGAHAGATAGPSTPRR
jgi:hypothetical protein